MKDDLFGKIGHLQEIARSLGDLGQFTALQDKIALTRLPSLESLGNLGLGASLATDIERLVGTMPSYLPDFSARLGANYLDLAAETNSLFATDRIQDALRGLDYLGTDAVQTLLEHQTRIEDLARSVTLSDLSIDLSAYRLFDSLVIPETLPGLGLDPDWADFAVQNARAYQEFAERHLTSALTAPDVLKRNQLLLVDSAADLTSLINSGCELAVSVPRPESPTRSPPAYPPTNVFVELDSDLEAVDLEDDELDVDRAFGRTRSVKVARLGSALVQLVTALNSETEREGKEAIFKPTTKTMKACATIPSRVACDESSFHDVVDSLYFVLYEGSAAASRLTAAFPSEDLTPLWQLKKLRVGARHDLDHGEKSNIRRKNVELGAAYKELIDTPYPIHRSDWTKAQIALYRLLSRMLKTLRRSRLGQR